MAKNMCIEQENAHVIAAQHTGSSTTQRPSKAFFPLGKDMGQRNEGQRVQPTLSRAQWECFTHNIIDELYGIWLRDGKKAKDYRVQKALSFMHECSGKWMLASVRNSANLLPAQCACDEYLKRIGFSPVLVKCKWCGATEFFRPAEDHAVSCTYKYLNRTAGMMVQNDVRDGLSILEPVHKGETFVDDLLNVTVKDANDQTKYRVDFTAMHKGVAHPIDVRLTSIYGETEAQREMINFRPRVSTAERAKREKERTYQARFNFPPGSISFFCVDSGGAWDDGMLKHFQEAREYLSRRRHRTQVISVYKDRKSAKQEWRWALETVSLGICKANFEYMRVAREGLLPNGLNKTQAEAKTQANKERKAREEEEREEESAILAPG